MTTESQRRASLAFKARMAEQGKKPVVVWLGEEARRALAIGAHSFGSQSAALEVLLTAPSPTQTVADIREANTIANLDPKSREYQRAQAGDFDPVPVKSVKPKRVKLATQAPVVEAVEQAAKAQPKPTGSGRIVGFDRTTGEPIYAKPLEQKKGKA